MTNANPIAETERVLIAALSEASLDCSGPELAGALQGLALRVAERCITPRTIAQILLRQAEAYLSAAGDYVAPPVEPESLEPATLTDFGHRALTEAVGIMRGCGASDFDIREMLLGFVLAWFKKAGDGQSAAAVLYRNADALIGSPGMTH